jgi:hypothetical protein
MLSIYELQFLMKTTKNLKSLRLRVCRKSEEHGCFHEADPDSDKRPDQSLNAPGLHGRKLILDASITCPYPNCGARLSRTNAVFPLRQANSVYKKKVDKYGDIAIRNRIDFLPLIAESTGRLHPQMTNF